MFYMTEPYEPDTGDGYGEWQDVQNAFVACGVAGALAHATFWLSHPDMLDPPQARVMRYACDDLDETGVRWEGVREVLGVSQDRLSSADGLFAQRSNDESTRRTYAFERAEVDRCLTFHGHKPVRELLKEEGATDLIVHVLTGWHRSYGGPGQWFWDDPSLEITWGRVFVRQSGGLDI